MDYADAINKYGSDKPDMRFEMLISDVTSALEGCGFKAYEGKSIEALVVPGIASTCTRKEQDKDNVLAKKFRVFGVSHLKIQNGPFVLRCRQEHQPRKSLRSLSKQL